MRRNWRGRQKNSEKQALEEKESMKKLEILNQAIKEGELFRCGHAFVTFHKGYAIRHYATIPSESDLSSVRKYKEKEYYRKWEDIDINRFSFDLSTRTRYEFNMKNSTMAHQTTYIARPKPIKYSPTQEICDRIR